MRQGDSAGSLLERDGEAVREGMLGPPCRSVVCFKVLYSELGSQNLPVDGQICSTQKNDFRSYITEQAAINNPETCVGSPSYVQSNHYNAAQRCQQLPLFKSPASLS